MAITEHVLWDELSPMPYQKKVLQHIIIDSKRSIMLDLAEGKDKTEKFTWRKEMDNSREARFEAVKGTKIRLPPPVYGNAAHMTLKALLWLGCRWSQKALAGRSPQRADATSIITARGTVLPILGVRVSRGGLLLPYMEGGCFEKSLRPEVELHGTACNTFTVRPVESHKHVIDHHQPGYRYSTGIAEFKTQWQRIHNMKLVNRFHFASTTIREWKFKVAHVYGIDFDAISSELSRDNPIALVQSGTDKHNYVVVHDSLIQKAKVAGLLDSIPVSIAGTTTPCSECYPLDSRKDFTAWTTWAKKVRAASWPKCELHGKHEYTVKLVDL